MNLMIKKFIIYNKLDKNIIEKSVYMWKSFQQSDKLQIHEDLFYILHPSFF